MYPKKKILFISSNDGSDMRINKELHTLSQIFEITYLGVGTTNVDSYAREYCKYFYLVVGKRNHPATILKQFLLVAKLLRKNYSSIHIINEQLMIFFYPFLFRKHLVLDIFDSIFLTLNKSKNKWRLLKKIIYAPVNIILVTDSNRKTFMPDFVQHKVQLLENYPIKFTNSIIKNSEKNKVTILYNGWLGNSRGTELVQKILSANRNVKIIMVGWFADEESRELISNPSVEYRGIMSQANALNIAAEESDYILCVYAPKNDNNINASPNKIYDGLQTRTPVIINAEIAISNFVKENGLGIVIEKYEVEDINNLIDELFARKNTFEFNPEMADEFTWEKIEGVLIKAHQI